MKTIVLLSAAIVAGAVRYPTEGPLSVHDKEADRLIESELAELAEVEPFGEDEEDEGKLENLTVDKLKHLAADENIELGEATKKAEIIAAIEKHRAG